MLQKKEITFSFSKIKKNKMLINIIRSLLNFLDTFQQKKIVKFFKKKLNKSIIFFDIGSHYGETVILFHNNLKIDFFHCFEPINENFIRLEKVLKKKKLLDISKLNNFALGDRIEEKFINFTKETSSSSLNNFNLNSKYLKNKMKVLNIKNIEQYYRKEKILVKKLDDYLQDLNLKKIDILKIDTEGYELSVLKGAINNLKKIRYIYFEHHYDNMIIKNYTFRDIHKILTENNFKKVFKTKMIFRKSFEYIYENLFI